MASEELLDDLPNEKIIAIDGTSGSGKSTLARGVANALSLDVLETGSLYRAVTLNCIEQNIDIYNANEVEKIAKDLDLVYEGFPSIRGKDISKDITRHEVVLNVSHVSTHENVRSVLTNWIRNWIINHGGGVVEGRDITTVVAPNSKLKIFVDAPEDIRVGRRESDKNENHESLSKNEVKEAITLRDKIDAGRVVAPLKKSDDAYEIDSSQYSIDEMINLVVDLYKEN